MKHRKLGKLDTHTATVEIKRARRWSGNAIYFLAGILFLFMQLKNEFKCFNLIKNGATQASKHKKKKKTVENPKKYKIH